jgi:glutathione-regulated potassium-efflux system protein KefB
MEESHNLLTDVMTAGSVLLGAALVAVLLFRKLGLGAVLGYLVAGIIIGPDVLGLVGDAKTILAYSEIGIILLLFLVGLELSPSRLWVMRRDILLVGPLQVALCGLAMFVVVLATENRLWPEKLFDPAISGFVDCSAPNYCRSPIAIAAA